jgi:glycosyltransferase involved in cell wall biosynthesis
MKRTATRRIAIVVQRYGAEINGGAELHARLLAKALRPHVEIDVLTSRALDYRNWDHHYPAGESELDGCRVIRFDHPIKTRRDRLRMPLAHKWRFKLRRWLRGRPGPRVALPVGDPEADGVRYIGAMGPTMPDLGRHLQAHRDHYAAVIFVTVLYPHTALNLVHVADKAILVPTLHDEKAMYLPHYRSVFHQPRRILYNTAAEQALAQRLYGDDLPPWDLCGVGVGHPDRPARAWVEDTTRWQATAARLGIDGDFLVYVGRVDVSKGCDELFRHFAALRKSMPQTQTQTLKLVVCGQWFMPLTDHPDILRAGFVSDEERDDLIAHALALVVPSRYESLSMVLLESLQLGTPVMVNADCEVLGQHVQSSGTGWAYHDYRGFASAVAERQGWSDATRQAQALRGQAYVRDHYDWPVIIDKFLRVIEEIAGADATPSACSTHSIADTGSLE